VLSVQVNTVPCVHVVKKCYLRQNRGKFRVDHFLPLGSRLMLQQYCVVYHISGILKSWWRELDKRSKW